MWFEHFFSKTSGAAASTQRRGSLYYSVLTLTFPTAVFFVCMIVVAAVGIDQNYLNTITKSIFDGHVWTQVDAANSAIADLNGRMRFAAAQAVLIATAWIAIISAAAVAYRTFRDHGGVEPGIGILALFVAVTTIAIFVFLRAEGTDWLPGIKIRDYFVYVVPEMLNQSGFSRSNDLVEQIERHGGHGGALGLLSATFVIGSSAVLAYRWKAPVWANPRTLRRRLGGLLALFAIASLLLVASNAAVRLLLDWPVELLPNTVTKGQAGTALEAARSMSATLSYWWSVCTTGLLLATFIPTLVSLIADVDLAATDAVAGAAVHNVVTAKDLREWKERHGLLLSASQSTTAALAAAAPLLTAPVLDLVKSMFSPP